MSDIRNNVQDGTRHLEDQIKKAASELKVEISRGPRQIWDQEPIEFLDAKGRTYPIALQACADFKDFLYILESSFRDDIIVSALVSRKDFWLFTPPNNKSADRWWYLINEDDWKFIVRPGLRLCMSLYFRDTGPEDSTKISKNVGVSSEPSDLAAVRFDKPIPPWSPLRDDLEFRWFRTQAKFGPLAMAVSDTGQTKPMHAGNVPEMVAGEGQMRSRLDGVRGNPDETGKETRRRTASAYPPHWRCTFSGSGPTSRIVEHLKRTHSIGRELERDQVAQEQRNRREADHRSHRPIPRRVRRGAGMVPERRRTQQPRKPKE